MQTRKELSMRTDSQLQKDVTDEIKWEPCTTSSQIGVSASNGVVTLNGTVASNAEKWAVERAATRVQGVKGLAVEISVAITGPHAKSDTEIAEAAVNALSWHVWVPKEIIVSVSHGWVTLMGTLLASMQSKTIFLSFPFSNVQIVCVTIFKSYNNRSLFQ